MASGPMFYERVARVTKHQAPGVADHEVNTMGYVRWTAGHTPIVMARPGG